MDTNQQVLLERLRQVVVIGTLLALPLVFDIRALNVFELPKVMLFRIGTEVALFLWITQVVYTYPTVPRWWRDVYGFFKRSPVDGLVLALWVTVVLATLCSIVPSVSWWGEAERHMGLLTLTHVVAFYFLLRVTLTEPRAVQWLFGGLTVVTMLVAGYAILQHYGIDLPGFRYGLRAVTPGSPLRAFSSLGHPNFLGAYLVAASPLFLYFLLAAKKLSVRFWYAAVVAFSSLAILFTLSRSVWLAFLVSVLFFLLLAAWRQQWQGRARRVIWVVVGLAVVAVVLYAVVTSAADRAATWQRLLSIANLQNDTGGVRLWIWQVAGAYLPSHPWLGYGPDTFYLLAQYHPSTFAFEPQAFDRAHNIFLDMALSCGVVAVGIFIAILCLLAQRLGSALRRSVASESFLYYGALAASLVGYLIIGLFNFDTIVSLVFFYLLVALVLCRTLVPPPIPLTPQRSAVRYTVVLVVAGLMITLVYSNVSFWRADVYASQGERALAVGNLSSAQADFRSALSFNNHQPNYAAYLGTTLLLTAQRGGPSAQAVPTLTQSLAFYNQARARGLPDTDYYQELLDLFTYWSTLDGQQIPVLLNIFQRAELSLSNRSYFYRNWGMVLFTVGDREAAKTKLQRYLELQSGRPEAQVVPYLQQLGLHS